MPSDVFLPTNLLPLICIFRPSLFACLQQYSLKLQFILPGNKIFHFATNTGCKFQHHIIVAACKIAGKNVAGSIFGSAIGGFFPRNFCQQRGAFQWLDFQRSFSATHAQATGSITIDFSGIGAHRASPVRIVQHSKGRIHRAVSPNRSCG